MYTRSRSKGGLRAPRERLLTLAGLPDRVREKGASVQPCMHILLIARADLRSALFIDPIFVQDAASSSGGRRSLYSYILAVDTATSGKLLTFDAPLGGFAALSADLDVVANRHLAHPPITVIIGYICRSLYLHTTFTIKDESGLKLGQVQDVVRRTVELVMGTGTWRSDVAILLLDRVCFGCRVQTRRLKTAGENGLWTSRNAVRAQKLPRLRQCMARLWRTD